MIKKSRDRRVRIRAYRHVLIAELESLKRIFDLHKNTKKGDEHHPYKMLITNRIIDLEKQLFPFGEKMWVRLPTTFHILQTNKNEKVKYSRLYNFGK